MFSWPRAFASILVVLAGLQLVPGPTAVAGSPVMPSAVALWEGPGSFYYLRAAPSSSAAILGRIQPGDSLAIVAGVPGEMEAGNPWWYHVKIGAEVGYVSSNAVAVVSVPLHRWIGVTTDNGDLSLTQISALRAPQQSAAVAAQFAFGSRLTVTGSVQGDALQGSNTTWYSIDQGRLPPIYVYSSYLKFTAAGQGSLVPPLLTAASVEGIDLATGQSLFALHASAPRRPASLAKLMTALVALQHLRPDASIVVPSGIQSVTTDVGGSSMGLQAGETLTLQELLYGMLLPSGNDAAYTVAQAVGGSQDRFTQMMNETAHNLGLHHTHFTNPTGLDQAGEYTTAADLARLARYVLVHEPLVATIVQTVEYVIGASATHPAFTLHNLNELLGVYPGAFGVKTGTTADAGENLIAGATRFQHRVIVVILGATDRYADATSALDFIFAARLPSAFATRVPVRHKSG